MKITCGLEDQTKPILHVLLNMSFVLHVEYKIRFLWSDNIWFWIQSVSSPLWLARILGHRLDWQLCLGGAFSVDCDNYIILSKSIFLGSSNQAYEEKYCSKIDTESYRGKAANKNHEAIDTWGIQQPQHTEVLVRCGRNGGKGSRMKRRIDVT